MTSMLSNINRTILRHFIIYIISIAKDFGQLQWLEFETRIRKVIKDLVEPVMDRARLDRETVLMLNKEREAHD